MVMWFYPHFHLCCVCVLSFIKHVCCTHVYFMLPQQWRMYETTFYSILADWLTAAQLCTANMNPFKGRCMREREKREDMVLSTG
mgnify:CR=1 FL=1